MLLNTVYLLTDENNIASSIAGNKNLFISTGGGDVETGNGSADVLGPPNSTPKTMVRRVSFGANQIKIVPSVKNSDTDWGHT